MTHARLLSLPFLLTALLVFLGSGAPATAKAEEAEALYVQSRLIPETATVRPGDTLTMAIEQSIKKGWHTYWKNPGDSGEALSITWTLPEGAQAGSIQWPTPHRMPIGPLLNFGYEGTVTFLNTIQVPENFSGSEFKIGADLAWLVCEEICIPETTKLEISVPVSAAEPVATDAALFVNIRKEMPRAVTWPGMVEEKDGTVLITFTPESEETAALQGITDITFFPEDWGLIQYPVAQENKFEDGKIKLSLARDSARALSDVGQIEGVISYKDTTGITEGVAVQVAVSAPPGVIKEIAAEETGVPAGPEMTLVRALILAVLGGLILNLMPCVFPVLSMKALSLVKMSAREQAHAVTHGLLYTFGILVSFAGIAALLIALQQAGNHIGWGFQLQNPIVVIFLAYLLFLIGLNLSGVFEISGSRLANVGSGLAHKGGYTGSFFTGMLATLVATPCTAPFMGVAMGYALTQGPVTVIVIALALGFGLALPYLLLTSIPPLRRAMPKPGHWMETFRQFLSFPMYASVAWLIWVYSQQAEGFYAPLLAMFGLVFLAMGIWMWKNAPARAASPVFYLVRFISVVSFAFAFVIAGSSLSRMPEVVSATKGEKQASTESSFSHAGNWVAFTQAELGDALKGNDPVFVNMTASWCITCKVNERVALAPDRTQKLFTDQKVLYLIGDWTNENPEITDFLEKYGRNGVPLYVYFGSRDLTTNQRPNPVVLPQLLTPGLIEDIVTYN